MAYGSAALSAYETARLALDKPILGANVIPAQPTSVIWSEDDGNIATVDDRSYTGAPTYRLYDGEAGLQSYPETVATTVWYIYFDFGASNLQVIDFVGIMHHDFFTDSVTQVDFEFDQNQNGAFTAVDTCPIISNPADNSRIMQLTLKHTGSVALRYSDVRYCRLKITAGGNFVPYIGELILGRRRQLKHGPSEGFNPELWSDSSETNTSKGGVINKTIYTQNRFDLQAEFESHEDTYIADLKAWWKQIRESFIWIYKPNSLPNSFHLLVKDGESFDFPNDSGPYKRVLTLSAIEQGPEDQYLENE